MSHEAARAILIETSLECGYSNSDALLVADLVIHACSEAMAAVARVASTAPTAEMRSLVMLGATKIYGLAAGGAVDTALRKAGAK
jgi:hypothetical protein